MISEIDLILSEKVEDVIASSLSLTLLKVYSRLYLNGGQPRTCSKSQREYYYKLKKDYDINKEQLERTCLPVFDGRRYVPGVFKDGVLVAGHLHIMGSLLTDKQAIDYLNNGVLKEKDFKILPKSYKVELEIKKYTIADVIDILDRDNYNELKKAAKALDLISGSPTKDEIKETLANFTSDLI